MPENAVWFITGCSTGLGRALAEAVLGRGLRAVVTARDPRQVADLGAEHGDRALAPPLDVTDHPQGVDAGKRAETAFGPIAVPVDSAGPAGARGPATAPPSGPRRGAPGRAPNAIRTTVGAPEPPLRLLLGKAASDIATARLDTLRSTFDTWRETTLGADFPEGTQ